MGYDTGREDLCAAARGDSWAEHDLWHLKLDVGGKYRAIKGIVVCGGSRCGIVWVSVLRLLLLLLMVRRMRVPGEGRVQIAFERHRRPAAIEGDRFIRGTEVERTYGRKKGYARR